MNRRYGTCWAVGVCTPLAAATFAAVAAGAPAAAAGLPCAQTIIAARRMPTGPAQYEAGSLRLANGVSLRLQGSRVEMSRVEEMAVDDPVAACYGPLRVFADAGPSRTVTVLDLRNGQYYATVLGTWPVRAAPAGVHAPSRRP